MRAPFQMSALNGSSRESGLNSNALLLKVVVEISNARDSGVVGRGVRRSELRFDNLLDMVCEVGLRIFDTVVLQRFQKGLEVISDLTQ